MCQVCVYKIGENNEYCCHHLPHCLRYHSAPCLFGLLACETPDFLEGIVYKCEFSFHLRCHHQYGFLSYTNSHKTVPNVLVIGVISINSFKPE